MALLTETNVCLVEECLDTCEITFSSAELSAALDRLLQNDLSLGSITLLGKYDSAECRVSVSRTSNLDEVAIKIESEADLEALRPKLDAFTQDENAIETGAFKCGAEYGEFLNANRIDTSVYNVKTMNMQMKFFADSKDDLPKAAILDWLETCLKKRKDTAALHWLLDQIDTPRNYLFRWKMGWIIADHASKKIGPHVIDVLKNQTYGAAGVPLVETLKKVGHRDSPDVLVNMLAETKDDSLKVAVIECLGKIADKKFTGIVQPYTSSDNSFLKTEAKKALKRLGVTGRKGS